MTLAASGEMSIGGSTATRSINLELGRAAGATSSMGETALRTLAGVASGAISMSNFYNKSNRTVAFNNANVFTGIGAGTPCSLTLTFTSTGTITTATTGAGSSFTAPGSFISPTGDTTGMSVRCHFTSITRSGAAVVTVFGTTVPAGASYDSGYVSFAGANKVITGSSSSISNVFSGSGTIYITDGTTTISRSITFDLNI